MCYNRIPIDDFGKLKFVDPISRQTFDEAEPVSCDDKMKTLFHMNLYKPDTWFTLNPKPSQHVQPKMFRPHDIKALTPFETYSNTRAGLYSQKQINEFWENIVSQKKGEGILKIISSRLIKSDPSDKRNDETLIWRDGNADKQFYIDKLISPKFFENSFKQTFGKLSYYLTLAGTWFATLMLIRFIFGILISVCKTYQLHKLTTNSLTWIQILIDGTLGTMTAILSGENRRTNDETSKRRPIFRRPKNNILTKETKIFEEHNKYNKQVDIPTYTLENHFYPNAHDPGNIPQTNI